MGQAHNHVRQEASSRRTSSCMSASWTQQQYNLLSRLACHSMPAGLLATILKISPFTATLAVWLPSLQSGGFLMPILQTSSTGQISSFLVCGTTTKAEEHGLRWWFAKATG